MMLKFKIANKTNDTDYGAAFPRKEDTTPPGQPCATDPAKHVLGEPQHWYPYPFIDPDYNGTGEPVSLIPGVSAAGFTGVAINLAAIICVGLLVSFIFLGLDRALSRGKRATPLGKKSVKMTKITWRA